MSVKDLSVVLTSATLVKTLIQVLTLKGPCYNNNYIITNSQSENCIFCSYVQQLCSPLLYV